MNRLKKTGSQQVADSALQIGDMMAYIQYVMQIIMAFLMISMMFIFLPRASVSATRIGEVLDTELSISDPIDAQPSLKNEGLITFNHVSYHYPKASENVLTDISFTARPGETTAIIGSTGSGKSTLINLIPRFYDVTDGAIEIDGVDIRKMTQADLRRNIGYVPQKGMLFSGDIASNIMYGKEDASMDDVMKAIEVAQAKNFVAEMEDGIETAIAQGGGNVSGGQKQRLSIARALVKKAPIYIFDDSFSALDFKTDAALRSALHAYTDNATVLIVAQRISTIMDAEQIIVLDKGKIVGIGTHDALMKNCETYQEIAKSQLSEEELA
ncbi:MAG: ATP-binding cassette, subfamily multidrug efflux pump [Trichococcus sp.]|nr:ATP-binding cassette, subfamily multidrug efflux pump [Trichococcus sp.]